jgi:hypothetical protein
MTLRLALLALLLAPSLAFGAPQNRSKIWSILRYSYARDASTWGGQLQNRYDLDEGAGFEEQINLFYSHEFGENRVTLIGTVRTLDAYDRIDEIRYALDWDRDFLLPNKWKYNIRLRHEVRDFTDEDELAHRFRIRQQVDWRQKWLAFSSFDLSSEFNFYLNEFQPGVRGFSSHRSILQAWIETSSVNWGLAYLNDYRIFPDVEEFRHVLLFTLEYGD